MLQQRQLLRFLVPLSVAQLFFRPLWALGTWRPLCLRIDEPSILEIHGPRLYARASGASVDRRSFSWFSSFCTRHRHNTVRHIPAQRTSNIFPSSGGIVPKEHISTLCNPFVIQESFRRFFGVVLLPLPAVLPPFVREKAQPRFSSPTNRLSNMSTAVGEVGTR